MAVLEQKQQSGEKYDFFGFFPYVFICVFQAERINEIYIYITIRGQIKDFYQQIVDDG